MKILLTGATSSQVAVRRGTSTFSGLVNKALFDGGHDVTWIDPSVSLSKDYIAEFDSVVVGLAPPTSTAAYRIYGALSVAQYANELGTLHILLDAPDPKRVWAGLRAIHNKPEELIKEFHHKRKEYKKAAQEDSFERLVNIVRSLYLEEWPTTLFPVFPWMSFPSVSTDIPMTNSKNLVGLNLDSDLLSHNHELIPTESDYWVADYLNSAWTRGIENTISGSVVALKKSKLEKESDTYSRIKNSLGCLVSTHKNGSPWWSSALSQSLSCGIPVVTDWKLSSMLGPDWAVLAHSVEDMNKYDRAALAVEQRQKYISAIPNWDISVEMTCNAVLKK